MKPPSGWASRLAEERDRDGGLSFLDLDVDRDLLGDSLEPGAPPQEKLMDADFFNKFEDDVDESDMALP